MTDISGPIFLKYWRQALLTLTSESHAVTNKYPEAVSVVQKVHKVISDIEVLAKCAPARVRESSQWTTIVNSAENRKILQILDGSRYSAHSTTCTR
jgi:hypothetical protein